MSSDNLPSMDPREWTNFTKVIHQKEYPAISPLRPELSQSKNTVLITGGSSGIGFAIAQAFIRAKAKGVVIIGRDAKNLETARDNLKVLAKDNGNQTEVAGHVCDATDREQAAGLWANLRNNGTIINVLVLNSAKFTQPKPLMELGTEEVWSQFEANVRGPLDMAERFYKQIESDSKAFLVNVSTTNINTFYDSQHPVAAARPAYNLTKNSGTLVAQLIAKDVSPDKMQVISFNPGQIWSGGWSKAGVPADFMPFDDPSLPGGFAVWAASKEAGFLHGRYVWASWDVDELATGPVRKRIDEDVIYLRIGVGGLNAGHKANY